MMEKIYILLPVHNRREITQRFIKCLNSQTYQNFHLILIDDGSTDRTEEMVKRYIKSITVLKGKGDWWWTGSLQQGYKWIRSQHLSPADLVLIINDDTEFEVEFLETAASILSGRHNTLLLAQCFSRETGELIDAGIHVDWQRLNFSKPSNPDDINCLSTRGLFLRVGDLLRLRGFHSILLPHYASDYEFTMRACRNGLKLMTDSSLKLWLDENETGYHQFDEESFIVFLKKYFSKKSAANPIIWTNFIALSCPWPWKFLNWFRIWRNSAYTLLRAIILMTNRNEIFKRP
ncbi:MAG: glycosyltransferase family 2 protein [Nitrospinae bacterium]|nr:glycosyltransferase family 2 protein [Nitrospinota bacterium]